LNSLSSAAKPLTSPSARTSPPLAPVSVPPTRLRDVPRPMLFAALAWLVLALVVAQSGIFQRVLPLIALMFATAVTTTLVTWHRSAALRAWTSGLDLRVPILLHVARIGFGVLFLVELAAGRLPALFAERGGYGDILAGLLAIVAALAIGPYGRGQALSTPRRALAWLFSIIGLVDIAMVFMTAQVMVLVDGDQQLLAAIGSLPYSLLPIVVVPLVVLTHLLVMQRLRAAHRSQRRSAAA